MIEDLKLQLDDALGAQDLVEQLTERNLQLSDLVKKLRDEIEEHETIAEINNELEEQHTINEKELREEIDLCESRIRDLQARNEGSRTTRSTIRTPLRSSAISSPTCRASSKLLSGAG